MFFKFMIAVISILVLMIVFAIIDDRRSRRADAQVPERVHIPIPVPEPEARECPTTDFYSELYYNLADYAETLAEELREEPA